MGTKKKETEGHPQVYEVDISDLTPDDRNLNRGTQFGQHLIEKSLRELGAGRSILLDKNNRIIAGNKTAENAAAIDLSNVIVVETQGDKVVAVKRTDIDLDSERGRKLAFADNATSAANLEWDEDEMRALSDELEGFNPEEWGVEMENINPDEFGTDFALKDGEKPPFQQKTFVLADEQAALIEEAMKEAKHMEEYKYIETMGNTNTNGNALYLIVSQWADARK